MRHSSLDRLYLCCYDLGVLLGDLGSTFGLVVMSTVVRLGSPVLDTVCILAPAHHRNQHLLAAVSTLRHSCLV